MSDSTYEDKIRKGQALNLAVSVAIADGKQASDKYIIQQTARFLKLASVLQNTDIEDIIKLVEGK